MGMDMLKNLAESPNGFPLEEEPIITEDTPGIPEEVIFSELRKRRSIDEIVNQVIQEVRSQEPDLVWDNVARFPHVAFGEMDDEKVANVNMEDTVEFDDVPFEFVDRDRELTMQERLVHKITMGETFDESIDENLRSILKTTEAKKKEKKAEAPKSSA